MPKLTWKNGSPLDFARCHYCKAPILRGQLSHTCEKEWGLLTEAIAAEQRIAAQQAEMVKQAEERISHGNR